MLGIDPLELRLKNANRIGDTDRQPASCCSDPSTVPVVARGRRRGSGYELPAEYRQMTREPRSGDLLPEHLVAAAAAAETTGGRLMAKHRGRGFATIEYPTGMNQNGDP